ncbi:hypothetical protein FDB30_04290 [Clostridium botulinum]|uniref:Uncharacterized protein n=2 Tax=Clostridium botulinum TaxID=1491 RepID=A0A846JUM8_CLOBO|nr:hypothetical protein [Clostridium botulinum]KAI3346259.1 hypothetical protein CIT18_14555 [Clostridium botulinum]KOM88870.1 hypothetical protein ACP51_06500 [Clostridium botulinum]KOR57707.1 hypothetical protein ADT22_13190 [Clostridium botulinum]MBY6916038.1 hypothetical protein [Clostridium botulinum]NFE13040.1 hypothetical protein [Clostridium botulinum]
MSVKRSRTKFKAGEKIQYHIEYGLDGIDFYISYHGGVYIRYVDTKELSDYEVSSKLLGLFYKLLDMEIPAIERLLKVKVSSNGITDKKGNKIDVVLL